VELRGGDLDERAAAFEKRGGVAMNPGLLAADTSDTAVPAKPNVWAPGSPARKWIALTLLVVLSGLAVKTIDPGKIRSVVLLLLGVFALRIVLTASASR
jgi:hypothetical protein